jgi:hypothetical protein
MLYSKYENDENGFIEINTIFVEREQQEIAFTQIITDGELIADDKMEITQSDALNFITHSLKSRENNPKFKFEDYILIGSGFFSQKVKIKNSSYYIISGYILMPNGEWIFTCNRKISLNNSQHLLDELLFMKNMPQDVYLSKEKPLYTKALVKIPRKK